jgi:Methionine synthase I, cobalamin-binding domain
MWPTASVSGFYFAHPDARYFTLGTIGRDQLTTYSALRQESEDDNARWLAPILG